MGDVVSIHLNKHREIERLCVENRYISQLIMSLTLVTSLEEKCKGEPRIKGVVSDTVQMTFDVAAVNKELLEEQMKENRLRIIQLTDELDLGEEDLMYTV